MYSIIPLRVCKTLLRKFSIFRGKGKIHSIFRNCLNGLLDHNYFFNIISEKIWINPRSIQITQKDWNKYRMNEIEGGDEFYIQEQILYIPSITIKIFFKKTNLWDPRETKLSNSNFSSNAEILKNLEAAKGILHGERGLSTFPPVFDTFIRQQIFYLKQSVCEGLFPKIKESLHSVVGLGPGLTPYCDDFLMGFMAAIYFMGEIDRTLQQYGKKICNIITFTSMKKTNLISQKMLQEAALGHFPLPVTKVMENLLTKGEEGSLKTNIHELLRIGASSGTATLEGILWGIELLLQMRSR